jgi:hypothetical protein
MSKTSRTVTAVVSPTLADAVMRERQSKMDEDEHRSGDDHPVKRTAALVGIKANEVSGIIARL